MLNERGNHVKMKWMLCALALTASWAGYAYANDEVVKRFQLIAESAPAAVDSGPAFVAPPGNVITDWFRRKVSIRDVSYDVRRTDSLVSPFAGEIVFNCHYRAARAKSEEEAKSNPYGPEALFGQCKVNYAFQSQKWVKKAGYCAPVVASVVSMRLMDGPDKGVGFYCVSLLPQD